MALIWMFYDQSRIWLQISRDSKIQLFPKGSTTLQLLRYKNLITVDYKYEEIQFCFLGCKVMGERRCLIIVKF